MGQTQSPPNQNVAPPAQATQPVASVQNTTSTVAQPSQPNNDLSSFWPVLPSLLWFALAVVLLIVFGKKLGQLLTEFMWRLRSGAGIKVASVELGQIVVTSGQEVSQREKEIGVRPDEGKTRENERRAYRAQSRDIMLVHRLNRSREVRQLYDLIVYVVPHKQASLAGVNRVEYFLGSYWGNKVFPSIDRSRGFAIATAAYGPLLCTAEVFFNDGTSVMLHRYLDFEMGASAPSRLSANPAAAVDGEKASRP